MHILETTPLAWRLRPFTSISLARAFSLSWAFFSRGCPRPKRRSFSTILGLASSTAVGFLCYAMGFPVPQGMQCSYHRSRQGCCCRMIFLTFLTRCDTSESPLIESWPKGGAALTIDLASQRDRPPPLPQMDGTTNRDASSPLISPAACCTEMVCTEQLTKATARAESLQRAHVDSKI